jgi:UPF0755 protein
MPSYRYQLGAAALVSSLKIFGGAALAVAVLFGFLLLPPVTYPSAEVVVPEGASARAAARALAEVGVIRSATAFSFLVAVTGSADELAAGRYRPDYGESALVWLRRLREADTRYPMVEVTVPEGLDRRQMADEFADALPKFSRDEFLRQTEGEEGYLFPDTYRFSPDADASAVADALRANFARRTEPLRAAASASGRSFADIVTMASIVEREATAESRATVAGILWRRIDEGMPLQVDAPFVYSVGRGTAEITVDDLASDDPYNTYKNPGLPPTPICSPGLAAIEAAISPEETEYRYFLTGRDGGMHYATTFEGHKKNRAKYLD